MTRVQTGTTVTVPWSAWYRETTHLLQFPAHWEVDVLAPPQLPGLEQGDIVAALRHPIGSPRLSELAQGKRNACVVVDDLARPTRAEHIIPVIVKQLHHAGIAREAISIVIATGTHGCLDRRQIAWKVGPQIASSYRVHCHDHTNGLAATGIKFGTTELRVNRTFLEADVKIAIGSILPHPFAAYSGGAKLVLPGLADLQATERSHKFALMGVRGGQYASQNQFRSEVESIARRLGLDFVVSVVPGAERTMAGIFCGDMVAAHRAACQFACKIFATIIDRTYDCLVLNAYPKDIDLIQSQNSLIPLKTAKSPPVREDGVILITSAASEGIGRHGLFAPNGACYHKPQRKRSLGNRTIWLYAPTISPEEARQVFWSGYPSFQERDALLAAMAKQFPGPTRAAVLPAASMQQIEDLRPYA